MFLYFVPFSKPSPFWCTATKYSLIKLLYLCYFNFYPFLTIYIIVNIKSIDPSSQYSISVNLPCFLFLNHRHYWKSDIKTSVPVLLIRIDICCTQWFYSFLYQDWVLVFHIMNVCLYFIEYIGTYYSQCVHIPGQGMASRLDSSLTYLPISLTLT